MSVSDDERSECSSEDENGELMSEQQDEHLAACLLAAKQADLKALEALREALPSVGNTLKTKKSSNKEQITTLRKIAVAAGSDCDTDGGDSENDDVKATQAALRALNEDDDDVVVEEEPMKNAEQAHESSKIPNKFGVALADTDQLDDDESFLREYFAKQVWTEATGFEDGFKSNAAVFADTTPPEDGADVPVTKVTVRSLNITDEDDAADFELGEKFEAKYNFRYEEKGGTLLKGHDRNLTDGFESLRAVSKRSEKRKAKKEEERRLLEAVRAGEIEKELDKEGLGTVKSLPEVTEADIEADENYLSDQEWYLCDGCSLPIGSGKVKFECGECEGFCLCRGCQKTVSHEHSLRKSKVPKGADPPRTWSMVVRESKENEIDMSSAIVAEALSKCKFEIDPEFSYTEVKPLDIGLTDEDLFELDEGQLNSVLAPSCLSPYADEDAVKTALRKGPSKLKKLRQSLAASSTTGKKELNELRTKTKSKSESKTKKPMKVKGFKPATVSQRRLDAYNIKARKTQSQKKNDSAQTDCDMAPET